MAENSNTTLSKLSGVGAHFVHTKNRRHPSMRPFILGTKSRVDLVDLKQTANLLETAKAAVRTLARDGKTILFVGGKEEVRALVASAALSIGAPYVATRWLGGTLTNFDEIKKRILRLKELEEGTDESKYTKLERLMRSREAARLRARLSGLAGLETLPHALVVIDTKYERTGIHEAKALGLPVVALMSSDCDVNDATYPIVANDTSVSSVRYILSELVAAYREGRDGVPAS
jgi:small subunit ribosomal protein S2